MSIYHWKLGDIALARVCQKIYAKVQVVKDEKGLFYDDKVLGISPNEDGSICATEELCYYVKIIRTKERLWLPYTSLRLAGRSRPFYGPADKPQVLKPVNNKSPRKRKPKEEYIVPMNVKISKFKEPDLNITYDIRHMPLKQGKYENAFKEFVRRGKEMIFDTYFLCLQTSKKKDEDCLDYLLNIDASTEDKFETVLKNIVTENEVENYLHQCWRYNFVHRQSDSKDAFDAANSPEKQMITLHTDWCLVCGETTGRLRECPSCPSAFHLACRREWLVTIIRWWLVCGQTGCLKECPSCPSAFRLACRREWSSLSYTVGPLVCDQTTGRLRECPSCPSAFHLACRREWLVTIIHRKNPPKQVQKQTLVNKILSSTRVISSVRKDKENVELCPSCMWGPRVGYEDVVWHKLGTCSWWPARVLPPGAVPACLLARKHLPTHWPLQYYGELSYAWGDASRMCLFLPRHTAALGARDPALRQAVMDACDDYIAVYLK